MPKDETLQPWWLEPLPMAAPGQAEPAAGLASAEARARLARCGPNLFRERRERSLLLQYLSRFRNPLVLILLVASAVSAFTGEVANFLIIACIVLLSVTLDFVQEYRASAAAEKLRQSVSVPHAAWLDQACAHCPKFPTAASRRSLGRVSVPVWLVVLSDQLQIVALVSLYLTN